MLVGFTATLLLQAPYSEWPRVERVGIRSGVAADMDEGDEASERAPESPAPGGEPAVSDAERLITLAMLSASSDDADWQELAEAAARDPSAAIRSEAVFALGEIGGEKSRPIIGRALADPSVAVRATAVDALRILDAGDAGDLLLRALEDADPRIRRAAWNAMEDGRELSLSRALGR